MRRAPLIAGGVFLLGIVVAVIAITSSNSSSSSGEAGASDNIGEKPTVTVPDQPATSLQKIDVVQGDGKTAETGDTVTVQYVGVAQSTGKEFDASWDRGQPFTFKLGSGQVIPGWDQGVVGMKEGGRRVLVIPGDLAYGPTGQPPDIGPNETLVFAIDLLKVK